MQGLRPAPVAMFSANGDDANQANVDGCVPSVRAHANANDATTVVLLHARDCDVHRRGCVHECATSPHDYDDGRADLAAKPKSTQSEL